MIDDGRIGARVAAQRRLHGLTQRQLAAKAAVSVSLLRKVEQGSRPATRTMIAAVTRALGVEQGTLTGQPYRTGDRREDSVHETIPAIRRELAAYRLVPTEDVAVPCLADLRAATDRVAMLRHRVDLTALGGLVPGALADLRTAAHHYQHTDREQVMALLADVYYATRQLLHKLGYLDLASLVADRYEWAAAQSGDPRTVALARVLRAGELDSAGDWRAARAVVAETIDTSDFPADDPAGLSVWGFLHLMAGYMCAHAGDAPATWAHYNEAERAAARLGHDRDDYRLAFGPTNVAIWGTALGVELMDGGTAVQLAARVRLTPGTPPERAGHHWLDLARAHLLCHQRAAALDALLTARRTAPQQIRYHPLARETMYALAYAERRPSQTLRDLATWMGLPG
jgi:transcriptional regulator with XRE-family HTH domain